MHFSELGLGPELLRRIEEIGYTSPTPIQEQAIPVVLEGRDVLGCAQTGTGKTASFTLPMIECLSQGRARARMPRSLILEPTRELAAQVARDFDIYGRAHKLSMALLIGGESFGDQVRKLDRGVDVLIATPGRMIDLFERGNILLSDIRIFVIDEADRMLDMGFIPDIERIVSLLPRIRQTLFFSATMPPEIKRLADSFLVNPKEISVSPPATTADTVDQAQVHVHPDDKRKALRQLLRHEDVRNALIFCNRKRDVAILHRSLQRHGFNAGALHGDLAQSKRTETLQAFRDGEVTMLVCSDVAARGLDIQGLSHVFNFDVPVNPEDYVHRIGRTGRAGRSGRSFTLVTAAEGKLMTAIERLIKREVPPAVLAGFEVELGEVEEPMAGQRGAGAGRRGEGGRGREGGERGGGRGRGRGPAREGGRDGAREGGREPAVAREGGREPAVAREGFREPATAREGARDGGSREAVREPMAREGGRDTGRRGAPRGPFVRDGGREAGGRETGREPFWRDAVREPLGRGPARDPFAVEVTRPPPGRVTLHEAIGQDAAARDYGGGSRDHAGRGRERERAREMDTVTGGATVPIVLPSRGGDQRIAVRRRSRDDHDDGPAVIGFGDHIPAFLLRPSRPPAEVDS